MELLIKQYASEQGLKLGDLARKLRMPLSNLSAIASGRRSVSLGLLSRISRELRCEISELFRNQEHVSVFKRQKLNARLLQFERDSLTGQDKAWTHRIMLVWRAHYKKASLRSS